MKRNWENASEWEMLLELKGLVLNHIGDKKYDVNAEEYTLKPLVIKYDVYGDLCDLLGNMVYLPRWKNMARGSKPTELKPVKGSMSELRKELLEYMKIYFPHCWTYKWIDNIRSYDLQTLTSDELWVSDYNWFLCSSSNWKSVLTKRSDGEYVVL